MIRTKYELETIKNFVDSIYNSLGNSLIVDTSKEYGPRNPELGYCFKFVTSSKSSVYKVVCSRLQKEDSDRRVLMHEYGHIYLGHLDGIHEELDSRILGVLIDHRGELIERINKECGIDFADKLIERVIDDPALNHSLHNIAMDMEVNSVILSDEDVEELEKDITEVLNKEKVARLEEAREKAKSEEGEKLVEGIIDQMKKESVVKLILPKRYHWGENKPFPNDLKYPEYLMMIIKHLDQFVKMLVSISKGGNGDTSGITSQDVAEALSSGSGNSQGQGQPGMQGLDELMKQAGMSGEDPYKGIREPLGQDEQGQNQNQSQTGMDHGSDSRDSADEKRESGELQSSSLGCGSSGGPSRTLEGVSQDRVDLGLEDVIRSFKSRVLKTITKKDHLYLYNRGINRSVIAPTLRRKTQVSVDPTIVFLIDVSGSMDTSLVKRILGTISKKMKKINKGLKYNIITWSTVLGDHLRDIKPSDPVPKIRVGGGTRMAGGIKYFKENYDPNAILVLISDFEDYLEEWASIESTMPKYAMYGFNYGRRSCSQKFKYFKVKECSQKQ